MFLTAAIKLLVPVAWLLVFLRARRERRTNPGIPASLMFYGASALFLWTAVAWVFWEVNLGFSRILSADAIVWKARIETVVLDIATLLFAAGYLLSGRKPPPSAPENPPPSGNPPEP